MDILIVMCLGILAGRFLVPSHAKKGVERISLACTFLLIFAMGSLLGQRENFWQELSQLGLSSALFFAIPTLLSIVIVFFLTKGWRNKQPDSPERMGK